MSNDKRRSVDGEAMPRRHFLETMGLMAGVTALGSGLTGCSNASGSSSGFDSRGRALFAKRLREEAAEISFRRVAATQQDNGDENAYSNFIGSYSKGLPHGPTGEVDPAQYQSYRNALESGQLDALDNLTIGPRKLAHPRASLSFCLQGSEPSALAMPPAPTFDSAEEAGEITELYWMALLRDVGFGDYATHPDVAAAVADINALSDFRGPLSGGAVTPGTLFRSPTPGDLAGPYLSQLLLLDVPYGTQTISHRQATFAPGSDHMTGFAEWLAIQTGAQPGVASVPDATSRYIRNLRDLAAYVQKDVVHQAYFNAALILLGLGVPLKPSVNVYASSSSQGGFINFGVAHLVTILAEVAVAALRVVWFQKWFVHRRLRPEAFGGRIHAQLSGLENYPIHPDVLNSQAVSRIHSMNGTWLLPQAFPEGSPTHPAYGAGHNTVAAACATVLKAFFDETAVFQSPVVSSADGTSLQPYGGSDVLTVGGEIDKLAGNIAQGRNAAGVHWRSDYTGSMPLGEQVAEAVLEEQCLVLPEDGVFTFTRFDGSQAVVQRPSI